MVKSLYCILKYKSWVIKGIQGKTNNSFQEEQNYSGDNTSTQHSESSEAAIQ